ncbi:MAG: ABC transporter ATP-binding protein [Streptosporangiales bacterium]|nr:ABC transporter ATP-binding protein [Streptosporangiales bacterium]MBO0890180.1 ABC transporter ATP-binding protein [Acidothermales bacterium]
MTDKVIVASDLGIKFNRNRRRDARIRELLFRGKATHIAKDEFWALRHVTFDVEEGESVGLVGANGHGKSTLLRLIAGVMLPDEGRVKVTQGVAPLIEITGGFIGDLTARENIHLVSGLHGLSKKAIAERFDEIVEFAEVGDFLDTPFRHFSSGMKVKLAFSVVTSIDEPIVLVDEVLAVGDRRFREKCYDRMQEMLSGGKTLFFVSHSDTQLRQYCKRGLYLRYGELVQDGPIDDVLETYGEDSGVPAPRAADPSVT